MLLSPVVPVRGQGCPTGPLPVGWLETSGSAAGIVADGSHAYICDGTGGFQVADLSDPEAPRLVGSWDSAPDSLYCLSPVVAGNLVFFSRSDTALVVMDVSYPDAPALLTTTGATGSPRDMAVSGGGSTSVRTAFSSASTMLRLWPIAGVAGAAVPPASGQSQGESCQAASRVTTSRPDATGSVPPCRVNSTWASPVCMIV